MKKIFYSSLILFVSVLTISLVLFKGLISERYQKMTSNHKIFGELVMKDLERFSKENPFKPSAYKSNAEELFQNYIPWQGDLAEKVVNSETAKVKALFEKHKSWRVNAQVLAKLQKDPDFKSINADWISQVFRYDHWNLATRKEVAVEVNKALEVDSLSKMVIFSKLPIPDYDALRKWSVVYFLKMNSKGKAQEGLRAYRHIAELVNTSSSMIAQMYAVQLLNDEHHFVNSLNIKDWNLVSKEATETYKRLSWGWIGLIDIPMYGGEITARLRDYMKPEYGVCGAAWEGNTLTWTQDFFENHKWFEKNYDERLQASKDLNRELNRICNLTSYDNFQQRTPANAKNYNRPNTISDIVPSDDSAEGKLIDFLKIPLATHFPVIRQLVGEYLLVAGKTDYFVLYKSKFNL